MVVIQFCLLRETALTPAIEVRMQFRLEREAVFTRGLEIWSAFS